MTEIGTGFANGALGVLILCFVTRWVLGRVFDVTDARLPSALFALGIASGRYPFADHMAGNPVGRMVGLVAAFALIWYLWWRRPATRSDATERAERAGA